MCNTKRYKTTQDYIFHILQHFTTILCNFTKLKMLFNAVVMNFTISRFFKILAILQSLHCVMHSGVGSTLAQLRSRYWIPKDRQEVKRVIGACLL